MTDRGTALVLGASSAIGRAVAVELGRLGFAVVASGRDEAALATTVDACPGATAAVADVRDDGALARLVAQAPAPLRCAVWATGVFDWGPAQGADPAAWPTVLDVNLTAAAVFTATVVPALVEAAPSALVYLGSGASREAYPEAVWFVVDFPDRGCPVEVQVQPQRSP